MKFRIYYWDRPLEAINTLTKQPHLLRLLESSQQLFAAYSPKVVDDVILEFSGQYGDPKIRQLLAELGELARNSIPPAFVSIDKSPEKHELERVRYLCPYYSCDSVDLSNNGLILNRDMILCEDCGYPDLEHVPEPFLVSKQALKKYDVFETCVGTLIVKQWVLKLLQESAADQIIFGKASIARSKEQPTGDAQLFWLRPKAIAGECIPYSYNFQRCPTCARTNTPKSAPFLEAGKAPGLQADGGNFHPVKGQHKLHIGWVTGQPQLNCWPTIVMSGVLLSKLMAHGVKGIDAYTSQLSASCLFPATGESPFDQTISETNSASAIQKPESAESRKTVISLKDVPWDCDKEGYIYFHLSTPEFLVLDPMTWEEDSEGPYIVKKFKGPGLYRLPVTAIKGAKEDKRNVAVDSATLVFIDNEFFDAFGDHYEWDKSNTKKGEVSPKYYQAVAEKIGSRFGVCTTPPEKFKSDFQGDGFYTIDVKKIEKAND